MNFPLDVSTCRVLIIFVANNCVGRNEWQSKRQGWPRRVSEDQVNDAMQQGKARRPHQCARHRVRTWRIPRARGRPQTLMYVSWHCVYHVYHVCICAMMYVRIMCVLELVLWARLTTVHRAYMLTHTVLTNTTCEEKKPQVHRRNQGPVAVRIQLQAGQPPASRSLLVSAAAANQAPGHTSGPRVGNSTSDHACKFFLQLRASAGWRPGIDISWPAACPPQIRVFVVCLCSLPE